MKLTKVIFSLATVALGVASAASSYTVKLYDPMWVGTTQLKAGEYKVEMQGNKAVFTTGKTVVEVPATLGTSDAKYKTTSFTSVDKKISEIDLGGTTSKIVISPDAATKGASSGQ